MSARDVIAKAAIAFEGLPHGMRYGLYDYSDYPGDEDPYVVRDPAQTVVARYAVYAEAEATYNRLCAEHRGQFIISALHAAGYRIVGLGEVDAETVERCRMAARDALDPSSFVLTGPAGVGMQIDAALRAMVKP